MSTRRIGYSGLQIALHWIVALLILGAFLTNDGMGRALEQRIAAGETGLTGATTHTVFGALVLLLVLIRLFVRWRMGAPETQGEPLIQTAAKIGHWALYALMFAVPALGAITWNAHAEWLGDVHETAAFLLLITVLGHAAMAIFHQVVKKDGTLRRIVSPGRE